ncbi:MAG: ABC transporter permease [Candidatus Omnitrophica bacterium CG11_big_fil_rev_8_21_14_0_20_45_26]|uniref:ABC transporter permease n=1 Tax=Candidatus Abzuiibacterium crystallinum TaxID=1974748 RepID=A0A2H0LL44_9BACT|nr:MAG: ABC transporter permease [Candidatus Omnitrophica bacterium CG11_big_fil_rev_8_21_14_0_20_45_26]PIW63779.1 MAG: ABC transporter permease [Candidatus Omnitrophica bacterium CG12_big_fil_rev_8_21_14_0_65_45_16]
MENKPRKTSLATLRKWISVQDWFAMIGSYCMDFFSDMGGIGIMFWRTNLSLLRVPIRMKETMEQMYKIGVASLPLVSLTSLFTGMVLALQSAYQLQIFSAIQFTSDLVTLSIIRELGPVLTAMVVAGRVGASIAAELGTMKVTEQIDALKSLATDPIHYLVAPRYVASFFMLFLLTIYADVIGVLGGYAVAIFKLGMSPHQFMRRAIDILVMKDLVTGLMKAFAFGIVIAMVGCFYGFNAEGGAEGVGLATTRAVVVSMIMIIVLDCFFTGLFYFLF